MGADAYSYLIVAIPLTKEDLFETKEVYDDKCDKCSDERDIGSKFCSECGQDLKQKKLQETMKPKVSKAMEKAGELPEEPYTSWSDFYDHWYDSLHALDAKDSPMNDESTVGFGRKAFESGNVMEGSCGPCPFSIEELQEFFDEVEKEFKNTFGLKRKAALYPTVYVSV